MQSEKNFLVVVAVNSGPLSVVMSSGMPKVTNVVRRAVMSSAAPLMDCSTMGQPEYRSTITT